MQFQEYLKDYLGVLTFIALSVGLAFFVMVLPFLISSFRSNKKNYQGMNVALKILKMLETSLILSFT